MDDSELPDTGIEKIELSNPLRVLIFIITAGLIIGIIVLLLILRRNNKSR